MQEDSRLFGFKDQSFVALLKRLFPQQATALSKLESTKPAASAAVDVRPRSGAQGVHALSKHRAAQWPRRAHSTL